MLAPHRAATLLLTGNNASEIDERLVVEVTATHLLLQHHPQLLLVLLALPGLRPWCHQYDEGWLLLQLGHQTGQLVVIPNCKLEYPS
jgi:hypothetical protein